MGGAAKPFVIIFAERGNAPALELLLQRLHARGQTRNFPRCSVARQNTLARAALDDGLRRAQRSFCCGLVAARDRRLHVLDGGANFAETAPVHRRAAGGLPNTLLCRFMLRHIVNLAISGGHAEGRRVIPAAPWGVKAPAV